MLRRWGTNPSGRGRAPLAETLASPFRPVQRAAHIYTCVQLHRTPPRQPRGAKHDQRNAITLGVLMAPRPRPICGERAQGSAKPPRQPWRRLGGCKTTRGVTAPRLLETRSEKRNRFCVMCPDLARSVESEAQGLVLTEPPRQPWRRLGVCPRPDPGRARSAERAPRPRR